MYRPAHNLDHGRQLTSRIKSWIHCDSLVESIVVMQALGEKGIPQWHWRSAPHSSRKNQNKQRKCAGYRRDFPRSELRVRPSSGGVNHQGDGKSTRLTTRTRV